MYSVFELYSFLCEVILNACFAIDTTVVIRELWMFRLVPELNLA